MKKPDEAQGGATATVEVERFDSVEDITTRMKNNPAMLKDWKALGEKKFLEKYLKPAGEDPGTASNEPPKPEVAKESDEAARLKAEIEEREAIIRELRDNAVPSMQQRLKQIEDENKALKDAALKRTEKPHDDTDITIPDLDGFKTDDLFDQEKAGKFLDGFKALTKANRKLAEKLKGLEGGIQNIETKKTEEEERRSREQAIADERAEIDRLRRSNPELFNGKRDLAKVEEDYVAFMTGLAKAKGFTGQVLNPATGMFAPEVNEAYRLYHDEKEGAAFKKKVDSAGYRMPEDFSDLLLIHKLRSIRNDNFERDLSGKFKPWSFSKSLEFHIAKQPATEDPRMAEVRRKKEAETKAIENRQAFAKELPAKDGANPIDLTALTEDDFRRELRRYNETGSEEAKAWLENVTKSAGWKQSEIDNLLKQRKKR